MKKTTLYCVLFALVCLNVSFGQNNRYATHNTIGWYNYFGTFQLSDKVSLHTEYQWRRTNLVTSWQQSLLRVGINYQLRPTVLARLGYAWIETYNYGEFPLNSLGRDFTEHRIYEMLQLSHKEGKADLSHRFMLEQRFLGRYSSASVQKEDEFPLLNRMRYLFRVKYQPGGWFPDKLYGVLYDEIFIGFGKNVNVNVFDQNRIGALIGFQAGKNLKLEGGVINQILQYGRLIEGKNVFQYNTGPVVNAIYQFDLRQKQS